MLAARSLIEALLERYPRHRLVVTTMTATGAARAHALIEAQRQVGDPQRLQHFFLPLDFPGAARRFVARLRPELAIFFETELWPNLLAACRRRGAYGGGQRAAFAPGVPWLPAPAPADVAGAGPARLAGGQVA